MICYKGMTFCEEKNCREFGDGIRKCRRSLTQKVLKAADLWWGNEQGGPPISIYLETPHCFVEKQKSSIAK